ncbi:MAG TPA: folylpolyglutamate synthase/dihydrofolate synthase family protein [Thermoanaerobaculia bacterium]|nr:folylpolyglutamate synthase/dihydrofolate synthase family protein [Thermoanaerobaculia bacterium]
MPAAPAVDPNAVLSRLEGLGIKLGLERGRDLLARVGDPQRRFPCVLVAGTNGKGSTSAFLAAMAQAAGLRTGLYTSPHLENVEERLRIDGRAIDSGRLGAILEGLVGFAERETGTPPTYFEAVTFAAFRWFAEAQVDLAVLEVGLGGRLDATNLADPILSLITPIGFDHQEFLGNTLAAIAREKAGILRPGRPALAWIEEPEPAESVRTVAGEVGADLRFASSEVRIEAVEALGWEGQRIRLGTPAQPYDLATALLGDHQAKNLGLAVRAAETLASLGFDGLGSAAIAAGAAACRWPGRLEPIEIPGGRRVLLDAAHNADGAAVLARFLDRLERPADLLFGVLADKDYGEMLPRLAARARRIVLTKPVSPRAKEPAELLPLLAGRRDVDVEVEPDPSRALDRALALGGEVLVACGSIYLVGELRRGLRERFGVPELP